MDQSGLPPLPAKLFFKIGEASVLCGVKPHVLRQWEQELPMLSPVRRQGNHRFYQHHELLLVRRIRELILEHGLTIDLVRARLDEGVRESLKTSVQVEMVGIGETLSEQLRVSPSLIYQLKPDQFEELICERLFAMGFEPCKVGSTNRKDGGIDIVFWPRIRTPIPFLCAAQVKHHRNPETKEGPSTVRDFAGVLSGHPFNAGLLVTNTSFSPDAEWFARKHAQLLRLRDFHDIQRWLVDTFDDPVEAREIPATIELCPGVVIKIRQ